MSVWAPTKYTMVREDLSGIHAWNSSLPTVIPPGMTSSSWAASTPVPIPPPGYQIHITPGIQIRPPQMPTTSSSNLPPPPPVYIPSTSNTTKDTPKHKSNNDDLPVAKKSKSVPVGLGIEDLITVLGGEPPMYQCNVCNRKFKTKAHTKYHEFCLKGEKPFKCKQCGQGFITKGHYEYHMRTHTKERPYVCSHCGKGFPQRGQLTKHVKSHSP